MMPKEAALSIVQERLIRDNIEYHMSEDWELRVRIADSLIATLDAEREKVSTLRQALKTLRAWDMLNPADTNKLSDAKWVAETIDAALAKVVG